VRLLLFVLGATVAAVLAGAGAAPAVAPTPTSTDRSSVSAARARDVSYNFTAEFGIGYEVEWTEESGSPFECGEWRLDRGTHEVNVGSVGKPRLGRITIFGRRSASPITGGWADGSAVAAATATVHRTWVQTGGWTPGCGTAKPEPFRPLPDDCGVRKYNTQAAIIRAELRRGKITLDLVVETPASNGVGYPAFSITAIGRAHYRKCRTSGYAPELPVNFGLILRPPDLPALRKLKPGQRYRVERSWSGNCQAKLRQNAACRFTLDMHVDIRRAS
jgi:hypothetical protein